MVDIASGDTFVEKDAKKSMEFMERLVEIGPLSKFFLTMEGIQHLKEEDSLT